MPCSSQDKTPGTRAIRILVTGFGPFPGVRNNPTSALVRALETSRPRLARLGIELMVDVLPVAYAEVAPRLETLARTRKPDAILHLGLAARRKGLSIETRAINRVNLLRRDARKASPEGPCILPGTPQILRATFPAPLVAAALGRAGLESRLSIHAGKYVCNQTLYLSLARLPARSIGFIHVPRPAGRRLGHGKGRAQGMRPTLEEMTKAVLIAILVMARSLRRGGAAAQATSYLPMVQASR